MPTLGAAYIVELAAAMAEQKFNFTIEDARNSDAFCVFLASLTYKSQPEIEKELREVGYPHTEVVFVKGSLTSCFLVHWDDVIAIAFKGTTTWREWANNCNVWLEPTQIGRIHAGFLNTINSLGPYLIRIINLCHRPASKIVLTGHSRGGALAVVFSIFLAMNGYRVHRVATFGAPKFGDGECVCRLQGIKYVPPPPPQKWTVEWVVHWLLQFKVIFIPVCLFLTLRFLYPAIRQHVRSRLLEYRPVKHFIRWYRASLTRRVS